MSKQQRLVLVVSILASFVAFLDGAIVQVALPAIQRDLGGGLAAQQWVVDAYLLTLGSLILIAGSLSDLLGRKKILVIGLVGFAVASLLCAAAPSSGALIAFRALQGIAGALLVPSSLAIIIATFSGPAQGKAIGSWTAWTGISFIIGPLLGGLIVDSISWRWIFAINVIPIAITLYLLNRLSMVKESTVATKVDLVGATLCALGLAGPVFALIEQPQYGWGSPLIYIPLLLGLALLTGFIFYEKNIKQPMLPLSLFRNHNFSVGNVATLAIYAALTASTFLIVVFLQQVGHYSALAAGLSLLPVTLILFFFSSRVGALAGKYGPRLFMGFGPIIAALGFLLIASMKIDIQVGMPVHINYWSQLFPGIIIFGIGLAITVAPLVSAILGDVPKQQAGIASAINNAIARVAGLIAIAAVGAILAWQFTASLNQTGYYTQENTKTLAQTPLRTRPPSSDWNNQVLDERYIPQASIKAFQTGIVTISIVMIGGGVISLIGIRNPKHA